VNEKNEVLGSCGSSPLDSAPRRRIDESSPREHQTVRFPITVDGYSILFEATGGTADSTPKRKWRNRGMGDALVANLKRLLKFKD
jgi:hypothetical protein